MKVQYDFEYNPPIPVLAIQLALPDESFRIGPLNAFVDTGADGTIVPLRYIRLVRARRVDKVYLRSEWGEHRIVATYRVDIGIGGTRFPSVEVVGDDKGTNIILGRNLLNKLVITLNGPKQELEIK